MVDDLPQAVDVFFCVVDLHFFRDQLRLQVLVVRDQFHDFLVIFASNREMTGLPGVEVDFVMSLLFLFLLLREIQIIRCFIVGSKEGWRFLGPDH